MPKMIRDIQRDEDYEEVIEILEKAVPKSRADDMKRVRQRRKEAGLVEFRVWVTPEQRDYLKAALRAASQSKERYQKERGQAAVEASHDEMVNQALKAYAPVLDYLRK